MNLEKKIKIAPSILSCDFSKIGEELIAVDKAGADLIHLDVMDGHFVPNLTFGPPLIKSLRDKSNLIFDTHLMVENPDYLLKSYADAGSNIITVHYEVCKDLKKTIYDVRNYGCKVGIALNPQTNPLGLKEILGEIDIILIMSVNPGFGGQKFIKNTIEKIVEVKKMLKNYNVIIEVDGGINEDNIQDVFNAGAEIVVAGNSIFGTKNKINYKYNIEKLRTKAYGFK